MAETPEAVAYALMEAIARSENKSLKAHGQGDREWILRTYHQCRMAVSADMKIDEIVGSYKPGQ